MLPFQTYIDSKPAELRRLYKLKTGYRDDLVVELSAKYPLTKEIELYGWEPDFAMKKYADAGFKVVPNWTPNGPGTEEIPVSRVPENYPRNPEPAIRWLVRTDTESAEGKFALGDEATVNGNPFDYINTIHFTDVWGFETSPAAKDAIRWFFRGDYTARIYWFEKYPVS